MRVLIVDDDPGVRSMTRRLIERAGIEVVGEAGDGETGLALARELDPDVVVMDLRMPKLTGTEAARLLRMSNPDIKVVMHSAFDEQAFQMVASNAGAIRYVVKGARPGELIDALRELASGLPMRSAGGS